MQEQLIQQPVQEEKAIRAPKKWEMSTPQGNQVLERKAETLLSNVSKIQEKGGRAIDFIPHFQKFFDSYESSIINNANCKDAGSETVKSNIYGFGLEVAEAVGLSEYTLQDLWKSRIAKVRRKSSN